MLKTVVMLICYVGTAIQFFFFFFKEALPPLPPPRRKCPWYMYSLVEIPANLVCEHVCRSSPVPRVIFSLLWHSISSLMITVNLNIGLKTAMYFFSEMRKQEAFQRKYCWQFEVRGLLGFFWSFLLCDCGGLCMCSIIPTIEETMQIWHPKSGQIKIISS